MDLMNLMFFANTHCLSGGRVLQRFFLGKKGIFAKWSIIKDTKCQCDLYILTHITLHMGMLNLKFKVKEKFIFDLAG